MVKTTFFRAEVNVGASNDNKISENKIRKISKFYCHGIPKKNSVLGPFSVNFPLPNPLQNANFVNIVVSASLIMGSFYMGSWHICPFLREFGTVISRGLPFPRRFAKTFCKPIKKLPSKVLEFCQGCRNGRFGKRSFCPLPKTGGFDENWRKFRYCILPTKTRDFAPRTPEIDENDENGGCHPSKMTVCQKHRFRHPDFGPFWSSTLSSSHSLR